MVNQDGKVTFDYDAISREINDFTNSVVEAKQPNTDDLKKEFTGELLGELGFKSKKELQDTLKEKESLTSKYEEMVTKERDRIVDKNLTDLLEGQNINVNHAKIIKKLMPQDDLFDDKGELVTDNLKSGVEKLFEGDLAYLKEENIEAGTQVKENQTSSEPARKFTKF